MTRNGTSGATPLRISVVVATYNRAETLRETLRCLAQQQLARESYEVIVVDDGSADQTRAVVEEAQRGGGLALRYLHHANRGPGYTQNRGIREARAPIVLLMADDIFMDPDSLEAHLACHARDPAEGLAVLGRVLQSPTLTATAFLRKWDPFRLGDLPDGQVLPYHMFWACNISFKREFMLRHGMFRDEMGVAGAAAHEDVELGYRLHPHGLRIVFCRAALGYHHHVETLEGTLRRSYERGLNFPDFRQRVPQPEIDVKYRDYDLATLLASRDELAGARRAYLMDGDRSLLVLWLRHLLRCTLFNRFTVGAVWLPLFAAAERLAWLESCMRENFYRGVIVYYFRKGCRDARRPAVPQEAS